MAKKRPTCKTGCGRPKRPGKHFCEWHYLARQPIEAQVAAADARRAAHTGEERARVPKEEWPEDERWCSGCQAFVPLFYTSGSRCKACASRAAHARHVEQTYGIPAADYEALLGWQEGRCYICRRTPRSRRLAVDHDHDTGYVRGLLCADNERGCNHAILGNITSIDMAKRIVQYLERTPYDRMRAGEPLPELAANGAPQVQRTGIVIRMPPRVPESTQKRPAASSWEDDPAWSF